MWDTILYIIFGGMLISLLFVPDSLYGIFTALMILPVAVAGFTARQRRAVEIEIKSVPELNAALNNELVIHYKHQSLRWSFYAVMGAAVIIGLLSIWVDISAFRACIAILYTGLLASKAVLLMFFKR